MSFRPQGGIWGRVDRPHPRFLVAPLLGMTGSLNRPIYHNQLEPVLVSDGRLAISVWRGPSPYNVAMVNGVERHLDPEAGNQLRSSHIVPAAKEI